jgi:hypothetical protein
MFELLPSVSMLWLDDFDCLPESLGEAFFPLAASVLVGLFLCDSAGLADFIFLRDVTKEFLTCCAVLSSSARV